MAKRNEARDHLRTEHYQAAKNQGAGPSMLARRLFDHLVEVCSVCERYWQQLGQLREVFLDRVDDLRLPERASSPHPREWSVSRKDLKRQEEETTELRRRRRRSWEQKSELLRTSPAKRVSLIRRSRRRFQSLLLAEALLEDGQEKTASEPLEAAHLFSLIPEILRTTGIESGPESAWGLVVRSKTLQANALRVAGDLKGAVICFAAGSRDLEARPVLEARIVGERASMEASLAMEQLRLDDAESLLEKASVLLSMTDDIESQAKVLIQQANLESRRGRSAEALRLYEQTAGLLDEEESLHLLGHAATGRIKVLCDLGRPQEAREILERHVDCFELGGESEGGIYYRALLGRISLALDDYLEAEQCFAAVVEAFLALDRNYDATLAALDLAETYLRAGKKAELHAISGKLLKRLVSHGVSEKIEEAVGLLRASIGRDCLTLALVAEIRSKLKTRPSI